ncbi:helicase associated domain-containing protein [Streptomyces bikiniensis]|uniref:Helicase associated domain-containing protein n=1 Tax=Streptomyces bikiniensis TaxID=1896 RepID=A0ABW8CXE4_STRBI
MSEHVLGITPVTEEEKPEPRMSRAEKWAMRYTAARQFHEREGHLTVPGKHIETVVLGGAKDDGEGRGQREVTLEPGAWVGNQRARAASPSPERIEQLSRIGMRGA